mgnify:CR=1 FL=1
MAIIVNPTAAEFKQMLAEKKTFLADFYATWCGPCKMLSYVLEDIAKEMGERIDIVKIDIDREPELTEEMDITIIPGLFFIKNGEVASRYAASAEGTPAGKTGKAVGQRTAGGAGSR